MERVAATLYGLDILFLLSFQVVTRDFRLLPDAISAYGLGRTARWFKIYLVAGALAAPLLAWQFWMAQGPAYPGAISVYLVIVALGRIGIALFPNYPVTGPDPRSRQLHHLFVLLAFVAAYLAVVEATPLLAAGSAGDWLEGLTLLKHLISIGFVAVVMTISPPLRRYFGLAERLFLYATAVWFLIATLTLPPL